MEYIYCPSGGKNDEAEIMGILPGVLLLILCVFDGNAGKGKMAIEFFHVCLTCHDL